MKSKAYQAAKRLHAARMANEDDWLDADTRREARPYIDAHRIRDPHNRLRTLDGRSLPPEWREPRGEYRDPYDAFMGLW